MIVGEARTDADATAFAQVAKRALDAQGQKNVISPARVKAGIRDRAAWYPMVWDDGKVIAVGVGTRFSSVRGLCWWGELCIAAHDYADKIKATDTLLLFALNAMMAEGRPTVRATLPNGFSPVYYRDMLAMDVVIDGADTVTGEPSITFWGHAAKMMAAILKRRPEWRL